MSERAKKVLSDLLAPEPYDHFFEAVVGQRYLHIGQGDANGRAAMLGPDPAATILSAHGTLASTVTCHSGSSQQVPPRARAVADANGFAALIREFHQAGYTVRIPEVTDLSPALSQFCRALEVLFETPASPGIFWSAAGADAPVHHDEVDLICIQLTGKKRWFISVDPPSLPNLWKSAGEGAPPMERHEVVDVVPGDVIYLPRGTPHTVQSTTDSIHLSIGFLPVTVREAMSAVVDHLSELDRSIRAGVTRRADDLAQNKGMDRVNAEVRRGLEALLERCKSDRFIADAIERRRARMIEDLPKLARKPAPPQVTPATRVRHHPMAMAHVLATGDIADLRIPGERLLVHRGAEPALRYIVETPEFAVADIPGGLGDEVKVALVSRLVMSGYLEV